jgi:hypothetical protein
MPDATAPNVLLLGSRGGVATALLNLLVRHPRGRRLAGSWGRLVLVDQEGGPVAPELPGGSVVLPPREVDPAGLAEILGEQRIGRVIELADVETVECIEAAAERGVDLLCTGYPTQAMWPELRGRLGDPWGGGAPPPPRLAAALVERGSYLLGSGMNPGIVNALVAAAIDRLAAESGAPAAALEIAAVLFTEVDTTRETGGAKVPPGVFPSTWHPGHCLGEVLRPSTAAVYMAAGRARPVEHSPHQALYRVRCGEGEIDGMLVPHEEVWTIGARYPAAEVAFLYRLPEAALAALAAFPARGSRDWPVRKLYPPTARDFEGFDRVGVLVSTRRHGELWMGFENGAAEGREWGTNPTLLQVAAGVVAGLEQLGERRGLHLVEELDRDRFLDAATAVLGPPGVHYHPAAAPRPLRARRVAAPVAAAAV